MSAPEQNRYHSVELVEEDCKGCTICVTSCPAEAIRVRDGKARIMEERCIDCGECIRRCPHHAKRARSDSLPELANGGKFTRFGYKIALPAPSLYGQFPERYSIAEIHEALLAIGFDAVFPVASVTPAIAGAARNLLAQKAAKGPLISSSCPTIIKYIQIRFPTLLDQVAPILAPVTLAARLAKNSLTGPDSPSGTIGAFFISPCSGKITEARHPLGDEDSGIDGVFSIKDIYLPLLTALTKRRTEGSETAGPGRNSVQGTAPLNSVPTAAVPSAAVPAEIAWGRAEGEAEATIAGTDFRYLAVDGIDACTRILGAVEDGKLEAIDFLELMACREGCVGGPLTVQDSVLSRDTLQFRERRLKSASPTGPASAGAASGTAEIIPAVNWCKPLQTDACLRTHPFPARAALVLDSDYHKALTMMAEMERIYQELPQLDCGCCGAPNCHALAEDIVRGNANLTDCVIILKERYRLLL